MTGHPYMKSALLAMMLLVPRASLWAQQETGASKEADDRDSATTLKVDVKSSTCLWTVTDEHGSPISGLKKEDFQLREDGGKSKKSPCSNENRPCRYQS